MKKYRLLKDLSYAKAGTIFEKHPEEWKTYLTYNQ